MDEFELYDLRVELIAFRDGKRMTYGAEVGDYFEVRGENIYLPQGQGFSFYNLAAIIPLLAAKQRITHPNDWMTTDTDVSAVDVHCGAVYRITRVGRSTFSHSEVSGTPLSSFTEP